MERVRPGPDLPDWRFIVSDVISYNDARDELLPLPAPKTAISIRPGREDDLAFIDELQNTHKKAVGWMPTGQLRGHLEKGHVLVAEACGLNAARLGYCIGVDKYFKREDTGVIYQMNVVPGSQRGYIGAALLKAMFEKWPYGVKLCCCWCAQDLEANRFWEAMGFVPLAFRTGGRRTGKDKQPRIHIFWQKQIGDMRTEVRTLYWYPSQAGSGALREDRVVLPIPPGTHWSDAKPAVLPAESGVAGILDEIADERMKRMAAEAATPEVKAARKLKREARKAERAAAAQRAGTVAKGGLRFGQGSGGRNHGSGGRMSAEADTAGTGEGKTKGKKREAKKNDPRLVAAARELRDRWMEQVAAQPGLLAEAGQCSGGKYAVGRLVAGGGADRIEATADVKVVRRLDAA